MDSDDRELAETLQFGSGDEQLRGWKYLANKYPDDLLTRLNYAQTLLHEGDTAGARRECEAVIQRKGRAKQALAQLALVLQADGDDEQALLTAEEALELGYRWTPLLSLRAEVLVKRGENARAAKAFLEAYLEEPHAWSCLQRYCALVGREYNPPTEPQGEPVGPLTRHWLYWFVDSTANTPDESGNVPGCDHTLRFVSQWCRDVAYDAIDVYQYVNAHGGFCDCEVIFNVEGNDEAFDQLVIVGGTETENESLRARLLASGAVVEAKAAPPIELDDGLGDESDESDEEDGADYSPILIAAEATRSVEVLPQLVSSRSWGRLAHLLAEDEQANFWLAAIAPDDDRSMWFWWKTSSGVHETALQDGKLPEGLPPALRRTVAERLENLSARLPPEPASTWSIELNTLPERSEVPRLLYFGEDFAQRMAFADGADVIDLGLTQAFHLSPSPDGRHLAYVQHRRAREVLVICCVATGSCRRIVELEHVDEHLTWLDAGHLLASTSEGPLLVTPDGDIEELGQEGLPSRRGDRYVAEHEDGLALVTRGGEVQLTTSDDGNAWGWSPDDSAVVFTRVEAGAHRVCVWDLGEDSVATISPAGASCYWPSFTADGRYVVFDHVAGRPGEGPSRIARVDRESGELEYLSEGPGDEHPVTHPSLPWIAWQRRDPTDRATTAICTFSPRGQIHVLPAPGSEATWWPS